MADLVLTEFKSYFQALYGGKWPFPWQEELCRIVAGGDDWPKTIKLPTASGKTACIDIAVFALAYQAFLSLDKRSAPRRVFLVVDRRVVIGHFKLGHPWSLQNRPPDKYLFLRLCPVL